MDKQELLGQLHTALDSIERCYPYYYDWMAAREKLATAQAQAAQKKSFGVNMLIGTTIAVVIMGVSFEGTHDFFGYRVWELDALWIGMFLLCGALPFGIYLKARAAVSAREREEAQAKQELDRRMAEERTGMDLYRKLMPEACIDPRHARTFIGYLESGRADSAKEAWPLFEEMLHRENVETQLWQMRGGAAG